VTINRIIDHGSLSQAAASTILKIDQSKTSALANYQLNGFSVERMMNFLNALGRNIKAQGPSPLLQRSAHSRAKSSANGTRMRVVAKRGSG